MELTGTTVTELVTTLRRADCLLDRMRAELVTAAVPRQEAPKVAAPRSWFVGRSVGVILLVLGALCVLAAGAVFIAVEWMLLPLVIRALILIVITMTFGLLAELARLRRLQATAEALAVIASGMFVLDLAAARRAGLPGLADLAVAPYEILAGVLLAAAAGACALAVRSRQGWLWSLDAAVALGMTRAAFGAVRVPDGLAISSVAVTVVASLLYLGWRRLRLPVARWSAVVLGALAWLSAVVVGSEQAVDHVGADIGRVSGAWPALTVAVVAGFWSIAATHPVWRRVAAGACLLPVLLVFEIVGWSHGWVVGAAVMLAGYVIAALSSGRVSTVWSPAVGGSALLLGLSSVVGLLPSAVALATRMGLRLELMTGDTGPWLLPLTALVIPALLPELSIGGRRIWLDQRHTAAVFVAALAVLPMLYGAGFWTFLTVLMVVAVLLVGAARLWRNYVVLLTALSLLVIVRICAYQDDLADPLAWTLIALVCLAWAWTEHRRLVRAGFGTAAGLAALAGAAQWLTFTRVPAPIHGLVIVVVGSLGLLASQRLRRRARSGEALTRAVSERVSVTWIAAGLAAAGDSPSHRAVELTVAGVATGITAYLSQDRRRAGWVSGVLLTLASWIRLADNDIQTVEWYTLPAAAALLVYGTRRLRRDLGESTESSLRCLGPGLTLALTPSLLLALGEPVSWRGLAVGLASVGLVAVGVRGRLAAPFALGVVATALVALRNIWPVAAFIPRWTLLFLIGGVLLGMGMTWESRVNDVRTAGRYVRGLR